MTAASSGPRDLILASASPRRRELLTYAGVPFSVDISHVNEDVLTGEAPRVYVERLARAKAATVAGRYPGRLVLAADTSVVLDEEILGKPQSPEDAQRMLARLSGREHVVMTGVAIAGIHRASTVVRTRVSFRALSPEEIAWYVRTGEPLDKAGAYALQGGAGAFARSIEGSVSNVIGLPVVETLELLAEAGFQFAWQQP